MPPGNDGLTQEFYEKNWDEIDDPLRIYIKQATIKNIISTSQHKVLIKLV